MPSSYPSALDALTNPTAADQKNSATVPHASQHANANDAIEAIQSNVGIAGSAVTTTLDYIAKVALPKGVLGYAQVVASQTGITTVVDLTGLSVAVTVGAGRRIKVTGFTRPFAATVATDAADITIVEGTTTLQSVPTQFSQLSRPNGTQGSVILTPTAGAHTYKLRMARYAGTGTITNEAGATAPSFILVEDIGAA